GARRTPAEDLRVRQQDQAEVAPDEPPACGRDGEEQRRLTRQALAVVEDLRVDAAEEVLLTHRLAAVRECDDHPVTGADERVQLGLGLGQSPRDERRLLRLERERLARRQRVKLSGALQRDGVEPLLVPDAAYLVRLPNEID